MKNVVLLGTLSAAVSSFLVSSGAQATQSFTSQYTSIESSVNNPAGCTLVEFDEESGYSKEKCPSIAPYTLFVHDGDARMWVSIGFKNSEKEIFLNSLLHGGAFSALPGKKAEWRGKFVNGKFTPKYLIIRSASVVYFPEGEPDTNTQYLAVIRLDSKNSCLVGKVDAKKFSNANANALAREIADNDKGSLKCLEQWIN